MATLIATGASLSPLIIRVAGTKITAAAGLAAIASGLWWAAAASMISATYPDILPGMLLAGFGAGLLLPTGANSVLGSIPRAESGVGSGTYGVAIQVGGALGVAVIGSALSTRYQNHIATALAPHRVPEPVLHTITGSFGDALGVASAVGGVLGHVLAYSARAAFMSGVHVSLGFGALAAGVAALLVLAALPSRIGSPEEPIPEVKDESEPANSVAIK